MPIPPLALALAAAVAQRLVTKDTARPTAARAAAAAATAATSLAVMGAAIQQFRSSGTTVDPLRPEHASTLVASGPFAFTRNPMYVGMAGVLVAHAVLRGAVRAIIPAAAFVAVIDRKQIPPEEAAMESIFGDEYRAYRGRVPRWIAPL